MAILGFPNDDGSITLRDGRIVTRDEFKALALSGEIDAMMTDVRGCLYADASAMGCDLSIVAKWLDNLDKD